MSDRARLAIYIAIALGIFVLPKALYIVPAVNPGPAVVLSHAKQIYESSRIDTIGPLQDASGPYLLSRLSGCFLRTYAVAHQGWSDAMLKSSVGADEEIYFYIDGHIQKDEQQRWLPIFLYATDRWLYSIRVSSNFHPAYSFIASKNCPLNQIDLRALAVMKL